VGVNKRHVAACFLLALTGCNSSGKGAEADFARARSVPVIAALEKFKHTKGDYPQSLEELVPSFMSARELSDAKQPSVIDYKKTSASRYELTFFYDGPGRNNSCVYRSESPEKSWDCSGYY
jgi:hypothetical protein